MPEISIFKNVETTDNPIHVDFYDHLEKIRDGEWEDIVTGYRVLLLRNPEEAAIYKKKMPTVTLSGKYDYRSDAGLNSHSGYLNIDADDVENINHVKGLLIRDKYVYSCFMSTGGKGLRIIFKINPDKHREAFRAIGAYLFNTYGIISDPNGISPSKPYIVSFDPALYISFDDAVEWNKYLREPVYKDIPNFIHNTGDFEMVMKQIIERGVNIAENYQDWLKVGFALAEQFGADGEGYFHDISRNWSKYSSRATSNQYKYCLKGKGQTRANISTFYYLAKQSGVNIATEQTKKIVRATNNGRRVGLKVEQIIENLKKYDNIEGADSLVTKVFDNPTYEDGEEESILHSLELYISNNFKLVMNEVTGYLEENGKRLSASDLNTIFISAKKIMPKLDYPLMIRLLKSDFIESYNPFFRFFESDGVSADLPAMPVENSNKFKSPLIDLIASTIVNDNPTYTEYFVRKWIVGCVSAAHKVHSPLLLCLLGGQGSGKTEWFRRLIPKELADYYAESKLDKEKDDELLMTENLWVMDDELGGKTRQDNLKLKNITSKQYFSLRRPYGDHNEKILRLAVLCGTSNTNEVMSDPTGNRRIIPVDVLDINKELYNSIDKKELWLEAYKLYKEGFDWRVTMKDVPYLNKDQDKYEMVVMERELIERYFIPGQDEFKIRLTTSDIKAEIEILTRQRLNVNSIGREMKSLGFELKSTREGFSTSKKWCVIRTGRKDNMFTNGTVAPNNEPDFF